MEQPLLLLSAAGILIVIAAMIWLRKPRPSALTEERLHAGRLLEQPQVEETVQRFVAEIKQENQRIISSFRQKNEQLMEEVDQLRDRIDQLEKQVAVVSGQMKAMPAMQLEAEERPLAEEDSLLLRNRYKRVFELQGEGLKAEEIAKRLGAGRGEVELILSLASSGQGKSR
ncbi:hypothetical protein LOK74_06550 [Brevibacillus humidisoli]|uniref:DUF6115 domain-containing protein n=1 Tax=Brevibacillus humidisoli TaxID=2895522 RepID=UPI001E3A7347|nr:hypothetical protein [Brevibacillus humidisoli]UFJ42152.1 hypothetical protein LOK74_06550 [Brevibacillus humidisoli]